MSKIYTTDSPKEINGQKWGFKEYKDYVEKSGRCPCGYLIQNWLSMRTHFGTHEEWEDPEDD